jgi:hypothetical protein
MNGVKAMATPLQEIRDYRNRLLHGRLMPVQAVRLMNRVEGDELIPVDEHRLRLPRIGRETDYLDWRTLEVDVLVLDTDFEDAEKIVNGAWTGTLAYLEQEWQANLVKRSDPYWELRRAP